ncbi:MAG TPA: hypothetical protein VJN96_13445 [Vicinamibacterales bacterium]|nr:hypothetical protein [Vicinamibacterales bacterium]
MLQYHSSYAQPALTEATGRLEVSTMDTSVVRQFPRLGDARVERLASLEALPARRFQQLPPALGERYEGRPLAAHDVRRRVDETFLPQVLDILSESIRAIV